MTKSVLFVCLGILGGLAVSALWLSISDGRAPLFDLPTVDRATLDTTEVGALDRRLTTRISSLEREVETLRDNLESFSSEMDPLANQVVDGTTHDTEEETQAAYVDHLIRATAVVASGARVEALIEAGFSPSRAQEIDHRVQELRVKAMQSQYEASEGAESASSRNVLVDNFVDVNPVIRQELGDADYERYLVAMNESTSVLLTEVLSSSAAEGAGMLRGDIVTGYDGQQVFDPRELTQMSLNGEAGQPVVVDILRNGQQLRILLPRGPLGAVTMPLHGRLAAR